VIWQIDLLLLVILAVTAFLALQMRTLLASIAALAAYSLFVALLFAGLGAVDVAFVEAILGSAFVGVLFLVAVLRTDEEAHEAEEPRARWTATVLIGAFIGVMLFASGGLPDRGDPDAPAHLHVSPEYLERSMEETETPNVVTYLLADYRSQDTFGETLVVVTAALAVLLILAPAWRRER
jgi:multicomponent Na+:H+ antiporter subunit B